MTHTWWRVGKVRGWFLTLVVLSGFCMFFAPTGSAADPQLEAVFERTYEAWKTSVRTSELRRSSGPGLYTSNEYNDIVALGVPAVPLMVRKMEIEPEGHHLRQALRRITKWKIQWGRERSAAGYSVWTAEDFPELRGENRPPSTREIWRYWWKEGRFQTLKLFEEMYYEYHKFKAQNNDPEAAQKFQRIKDLGIPALPAIVEKVRLGDESLIPAITYLTDGAVKQDTKCEDAAKWWEENKAKWTLPGPDKPSSEEAPPEEGGGNAPD